MHEIDLSTWPRRRHFELYNTFNHPHFSLCANLDITAFREHIQERGIAFTLAFVYAIARAANAIPEFRRRIHSEKVIEHDTVSPSFTVLADDDLFGFCTIPYAERFAEFAARGATAMARAKEHPSLVNEPGRDDLLYMTALPWVSFTSFTHPMQQDPADSIPRFAWGKLFDEGERLKLPLSVQGHHALMDGIHVAKFYEPMQDLLLQPVAALG